MTLSSVDRVGLGTCHYETWAQVLQSLDAIASDLSLKSLGSTMGLLFSSSFPGYLGHVLIIPWSLLCVLILFAEAWNFNSVICSKDKGTNWGVIGRSQRQQGAAGIGLPTSGRKAGPCQSHCFQLDKNSFDLSYTMFADPAFCGSMVCKWSYAALNEISSSNLE
jgi:hypothetical protein